MAALFESKHRTTAIEELNRSIDDRDVPVTANIVNALAGLPLSCASLDAAQQDAAYPASEAVVVAKLFDSLSAKRGKAFSTTLATAESFNTDDDHHRDLSRDVVSHLIRQFDELPEFEQRFWIGEHWDDVKSPAWTATVRGSRARGETEFGGHGGRRRRIRPC